METTVIIENDGFLGLWASLVTQMVKICLQCRRPRLSLGWDDPLEKEMASPVFLPGEFHGQKSLYRLQSMG